MLYIYIYLDQPGGQDQDNGNTGSSNQDGDNQQEKEGSENQTNTDDNQQSGTGTVEGVDSGVNGTDTATTPAKKGMTWLPIIIIGASIAVLLLVGLIVLLIRKKRAKDGYGRTPQNDPTQRG